MTISIPSTVFTKYKEAADEMIDSLGVPCKLIYSGKVTPVSTDLPTSKQQRRMSVNTSAPAGFARGDEDFKMVEPTEDITLRLYWSSGDWRRAGLDKIGGLEVPNGSVMTIGYLTDMPKIQKCVALLANTNFEEHLDYRFHKLMQPQPWGLLQDRYFVCMWGQE